MNLLDFILHSTYTHSTDTRDIQYCLGGTVTRQLLHCMTMSIRGPRKQKIFKKLCKQFQGLDQEKHQIIIPDIDKSCYNVIAIMIDNDSPNYITKVLFYDCLVRLTTRSLMKHTTPPRVKDSLPTLSEFSTNSFSS